jgi:hypothetical protein
MKPVRKRRTGGGVAKSYRLEPHAIHHKQQLPSYAEVTRGPVRDFFRDLQSFSTKELKEEVGGGLLATLQFIVKVTPYDGSSCLDVQVRTFSVLDANGKRMPSKETSLQVQKAFQLFMLRLFLLLR